MTSNMHFTLIVISHLSFFAWSNAKHNEVQVQADTPLPIPVFLTLRDMQTVWGHPHRQLSTLAGEKRLTGGTITPWGQSHGSVINRDHVLLYNDLSLPACLSLSLFSSLSHTLLARFSCSFPDPSAFARCDFSFPVSLLSHHTYSMFPLKLLLVSHFFLPTLGSMTFLMLPFQLRFE